MGGNGSNTPSTAGDLGVAAAGAGDAAAPLSAVPAAASAADGESSSLHGRRPVPTSMTVQPTLQMSALRQNLWSNAAASAGVHRSVGAGPPAGTSDS
jgi:hypothetical protein